MQRKAISDMFSCLPLGPSTGLKSCSPGITKYASSFDVHSNRVYRIYISFSHKRRPIPRNWFNKAAVGGQIAILIQEYSPNGNNSFCLNIHLNKVFAFLSKLKGFPTKPDRNCLFMLKSVVYVSSLLCLKFTSAHSRECV